MSPHLLYVGGEDHHLRIPFMLAMRECGFQATAAGSGDSTPFRRAGIDFRPFKFNRYMSPFADWTAIKALSTMLRELQPDLAQSFDTKPNLLLPLAARAVGHPAIVRTITGVGWVYSSHSALALLARPVLRALNRAAAQSTAATVFEIHDDQVFFDSHHMTGKNGLVIPAGGGGIDLEGFRRALVERPPATQLREELGLGTSPVVITVTRMTRGKGIPTLLKAAALVHLARPDVRFLLVGPRESEGPLAAHIEPFATSMGSRDIRWPRFVGRSGSLLVLADGFNNSAFPILKMALLAPMPSASVITATTVNPGRFSKPLTP